MLLLPPIPQAVADPREWIEEAAPLLQQVREGKLDAVAELTLEENVATTVLTDNRLAFDTAIIAVPATQNAALELYGGTMWIDLANRLPGSATINHANNAQTDRTFQFVLIR